MKFIEKIPKIIDVKPSRELEIACKELGLDAKKVASAGISLSIILLPIVLFLSILFGLKVLFLSIFLILIALLIPEYPKALYKRKILEHIEECPYIFSILSSIYSTTKNFEKSFSEVYKSFRKNKIIEKIKKKLKERFYKGEERIEVENVPDEIKDFFDYINISFTLPSKREIIEKGFEEFMRKMRKKRIEAIGKVHTKILIVFTFGSVLPIIILSAFPLFSIFIKGYSRYIFPFLILTTSILFNFILISGIKFDIRIGRERIEVREKFPKFVFVIPLIVSSISILYLFRFFGVFAEIKILKAIGLNLIPFSFVLAYFIGEFIRCRRYLEIEKKVNEEIKKLPAISNGLKNYLSIGISFEKAFSKVVDIEGFSKIGKWFIEKVKEMREKGKNVLVGFCETFSRMMEILEEYREEIMKRVQTISAMMKYTAIFILPMISAIIVKSSMMIFKSYQEAEEMLKETELIFPYLSIKVSEEDISIISFMMMIYLILSSYLLLDFSYYLSNGETPSKRILVARDTLISSSIFLFASILVHFL